MHARESGSHEVCKARFLGEVSRCGGQGFRVKGFGFVGRFSVGLRVSLVFSTTKA